MIYRKEFLKWTRGMFVKIERQLYFAETPIYWFLRMHMHYLLGGRSTFLEVRLPTVRHFLHSWEFLPYWSFYWQLALDLGRGKWFGTGTYWHLTRELFELISIHLIFISSSRAHAERPRRQQSTDNKRSSWEINWKSKSTTRTTRTNKQTNKQNEPSKVLYQYPQRISGDWPWGRRQVREQRWGGHSSLSPRNTSPSQTWAALWRLRPCSKEWNHARLQSPGNGHKHIKARLFFLATF